jgi:hypothetical protein
VRAGEAGAAGEVLRVDAGLAEEPREVSLPKVNRSGASAVRSSDGASPVVALTTNTEVKAWSMSRWATGCAPGVCSRAWTPVSPPNQTRSRSPVRKRETAAA